MQIVNAALQAELDKGQFDPRILVDVYELYESSYIPGATGYDPVDAIETFAAQEITWNGIEYRREVVSRGDIIINFGEKTNSCSLTFSNISRYLATLAENQQIEGLLLVIRVVSPDVEDDSIVRFSGRCDKPSDIDKKRFSLSARQDFGNINQSVPPWEFSSVDPDGRVPSDPLFKGILSVAVHGTITFPRVEPSTSFFGRLFSRRQTVYYTEQWSSSDGGLTGQKRREVFGRVQLQLRAFSHADKGTHVGYLMEACNGPIFAIENIKSRTEGFSDPVCTFIPTPPAVHLGDPGGTGTNTGNTCQADLGGGQLFSHLAYIEGASTGSAADATDEPPVVTALVFGRIVPLPDGTGTYVLAGWTDNPVHIARFILTDSNFVNIDPGFMEDSINYLTAQYCDAPLIDETNDEMIVIHQDDYPDVGTTFTRYRSTGLLTPRVALYRALGDTSILPELVDGPYEPWDPADPIPPLLPGATPTYTRQKLLRKRYTANFPITEEVRAVDLLYKTVFPAFRGYLRINKYGKYEIRSEVAADATHIRSSTAVGATSIPVLNVTPWKSGPEWLSGRILLGTGILTSEVRTPSAAVYSTSGNSVTLDATASGGGITATESGANLSGGSTTVQASGTVTFGGTPAPGNSVTITIDGIAITYTLGAEDTTGTVAIMVKDYINATPRLQPYILASWDSGSPNVVTIKCLHGALTVPALLKAHSGPIADPSVAPTIAAAGSGSLDAGIYYVTYADLGGGGLTAITPIANVTLTANQKINVSSLPAFPAGVTERYFYISEETGSQNLRFVTTRADATNFSIDSLPEPGAALPPSSNTTAEEMIRVAMSFATNSQDVYPAWRPSTLVALNDIWLPDPLNGHKYQATSITTGITAATQPVFPTTAGGTVVDGGVTWTEIGSTVLAQAGLTRANVVKDTFSFPGGSKQSSVNQIKGNFRSAKDDFALTPFKVNDRVHQELVKKQYPMEIDLSAVDNWHQVERLANGALSKYRDGDWFLTLEAGPQALVLEEGDVICGSDDAGGLINAVTRIEELRIKPNHHVVITQARKYSSQMFSDDVGAHRITIPSTLKLTRPRAITDLLVVQDGSGNWLITFIGNPRPLEEPETYTVLIGASSDWSDVGANTVRSLPVTRATSHAGLLYSTEIGIGDVITSDGFIGSGHTSVNNLYTGDFVDGPQYGITLDTIDRTFQRVDFSIRWRGPDRNIAWPGPGTAGIAKVGLQPITDVPATTVDLIAAIDWAECPIMVEWSAGTNPYTIKETYKSYGVSIPDQVLRDNVDPGYGSFGVDKRKGPRYTFQLSGTEIRAHTNIIVGQKPNAIVTSPLGGFDFPMRLVMQIFWKPGAEVYEGINVEDIMIGGDYLSTVYSTRDQEADGGIVTTLYGAIYQNSRFAEIPDGFPVYFEKP